MKKILMLIFLAGAVNAAVAQESPKAKSLKELNLTEQQDKQLKDINRSYMAGAKSLREDNSLSKEDKKAKLDALGTERNGKIKSVLNADQYAKWESNRSASHERMNRERKPGMDRRKDHARAGMEDHKEAIKSLGLNEEQTKQMQSINKDFKSKAGALRDNKDLSKEQRMSEFRKLNDDRMAQIKTTLGDEKYAQYSELQKKMRNDGMRKRKDGQKPAEKPNVQ